MQSLEAVFKVSLEEGGVLSVCDLSTIYEDEMDEVWNFFLAYLDFRLLSNDYFYPRPPRRVLNSFTPQNLVFAQTLASWSLSGLHILN